MKSDDVPPQFQERKRPEPQLYEELPAELTDVPDEPLSEEPPPRPPEPFLRRG